MHSDLWFMHRKTKFIFSTGVWRSSNYIIHCILPQRITCVLSDTDFLYSWKLFIDLHYFNITSYGFSFTMIQIQLQCQTVFSHFWLSWLFDWLKPTNFELYPLQSLHRRLLMEVAMQTPYRGLNWDDEWKGNITKYSKYRCYHIVMVLFLFITYAQNIL